MTRDQIKIRPVGVVRSEQTELSFGADREGDTWRAQALRSRSARDTVARIEIDPALDGILDGVEDYSHLLVLWWPDRGGLRPGGVKVHPMGRQDLPEVGIFATRSPRRPNSILVTAVELVARRGNVLEVRGLDAVDGTPVIDIKPLTPGDCPTGELRVPDWLAGVHREFAELDDGTSPPDD